MKKKIVIHWFRRDLRLDDNAALHQALKNHERVLPLFIFDADILNRLDEHNDARVSFIYQSLETLHLHLTEFGSAIIVRYGKVTEVWKQLLIEFNIEAVYANHDYEPDAIVRDLSVKKILAESGIPFHTFKDQVIFEKNEVVKSDGTPYTVFTPYSRRWKETVIANSFLPFQTGKYFKHFYKTDPQAIISLHKIGFEKSNLNFPPLRINRALISDYDQTRDIPSIAGTSRLSVHLRFGTVSIRKLMKIAYDLNEKFLNELIWREFYQMILWQFPFVVNKSFKVEYDRIEWRNNEKEFDAWCAGRTGYPLVDAGLRELNLTGFMHNRVRMVTAGFLTKHLLVDWRWGEAYFAKKLLDFELASNNGGWQWAAGTGVDAAPYFRIFNPTTQAKKFDPELKYIRRWVPEINEPDYASQIVDHQFARQRALAAYKKALS